MMCQRKQKGFTLIEVLIAVTISIVLLGGVITLMTVSKRTYNYQHDRARLQENGRFAMEFMERNLRIAGFYGCSGIYPDNHQPILGVDDDGTSPNDSDVVMVSFMDTDRNAFGIRHCPRNPDTGVRQSQDGVNCVTRDSSTTVLTPGTLVQGAGTDLSTAPLLALNGDFVSQRGDAQVGDLVLATSCSNQADIYTIANINDTAVAVSYVDNTGATQTGLKANYDNGNLSYGSELRSLRLYRYFIDKSGERNGQNVYTLYRDSPYTAGVPDITAARDLTTAEALIEGVEAMQIRYGKDTDGDGTPNRYLTAGGVMDGETSQVDGWAKVVGIRLTFLMVTDAKYDREEDTATYTLDPDQPAFAPASRAEKHQRRQIFTTTVQTRNNSL